MPFLGPLHGRIGPTEWIHDKINKRVRAMTNHAHVLPVTLVDTKTDLVTFAIFVANTSLLGKQLVFLTSGGRANKSLLLLRIGDGDRFPPAEGASSD